MPPSARPPRFAQPVRVLVIDDEEVDRRVAGQLCVLFGADVDCASSGSEAIQQCIKTRYDLLLVDIRMPVIDGIETAASIRMLGGAATDLPIIAVTADVDALSSERCTKVGIKRVIEKPLQMVSFFTAMQAALDEAPCRSLEVFVPGP